MQRALRTIGTDQQRKRTDIQRVCSTRQHDGVLNAREMTAGDFVSTHPNEFWGNILEVTNDEVKVRGFCTVARKLITKRRQAKHLQRDDRVVRWKRASRILRRCAIAKIHQGKTAIFFIPQKDRPIKVWKTTVFQGNSYFIPENAFYNFVDLFHTLGIFFIPWASFSVCVFITAGPVIKLCAGGEGKVMTATRAWSTIEGICDISVDHLD